MGLRIRSLRLDAHQTLAETASATGVSESLLSRIENGHRRPARCLLERLAEHFSVAIDELATDDDPPVARAAIPRPYETSWPLASGTNHEPSGGGALVLADLAIATALGQLRSSLGSNDHVERYRAVRALAKLASQPLEVLHEVRRSDPDPTVREATRQLLQTLVEAYAEQESA